LVTFKFANDSKCANDASLLPAEAVNFASSQPLSARTSFLSKRTKSNNSAVDFPSKLTRIKQGIGSRKITRRSRLD